MWLCSGQLCGKLRESRFEHCECGRIQCTYVPDAAEIAIGCREVQDGWTHFEERRRRTIKNKSADTVMISQYPRGRRVVRGRDNAR